MRLSKQQADFQARLLGEGRAGLSPGEAVYHHAYRARLVDALGDTCDQVRAYLGDEAFAAAARAYAESHPSSDWTLDAYGHAFPAFLAARFPRHPEIAELAALQMGLSRLFTAADTAPLDPAALAEADWATARLVLTPALSFVPVTTNAAALLNALSVNEAPPAATALPLAAAVLLWRQGLDVRYRTVDGDEYDALRASLAGDGFAAICERLAARVDATEVASAWLGQWIGDGLIIGLA